MHLALVGGRAESASTDGARVLRRRHARVVVAAHHGEHADAGDHQHRGGGDQPGQRERRRTGVSWSTVGESQFVAHGVLQESGGPAGVGRGQRRGGVGGTQPGDQLLVVHVRLPSRRLLMSGRPVGLSSTSSSFSFSRARCRRMLAALGVMSRTVAISVGVSCSHAQRRSSSASSSRRAARASVRSASPCLAGTGLAGGRRVDDRDPGREPLLPAYAALCVGQAVARHAVGPRQRLVGHVVEPPPADEQGLGEHVVGRRGVGTPCEEAPERLDESRRERLEPLPPEVPGHDPHGVTCPGRVRNRLGRVRAWRDQRVLTTAHWSKRQPGGRFDGGWDETPSAQDDRGDAGGDDERARPAGAAASPP